MSCIEYRRRRLSGIRRGRLPIDLHADTCIGCAAFDRAVAGLDAAVEAAARIEVPQELTQRILLDRHLRARRGLLRMAAATSLVALGGGGLIAAHLLADRTHLAQAALDHVMATADEPSHATGPVAVEQAVQAFARLGGRLRGPLGEVVLCRTCEIDGRDIQHLVVRAAPGRVAVLLLPWHKLAARQETRRAGHVAVVVPAGRGSLGVVARTMAAVAGMQQAIERQVDWADDAVPRS